MCSGSGVMRLQRVQPRPRGRGRVVYRHTRMRHDLAGFRMRRTRLLAVDSPQIQGVEKSEVGTSFWIVLYSRELPATVGYAFASAIAEWYVMSRARLIYHPKRDMLVTCNSLALVLSAEKDVRASHDALVDLFGRIESFFKVYTETSSTAGFAEVLVNVVVEVLNILSIATKEMEQSRAKTYIKKLLGRTDIEDSLKRLDSLIREEHQAATAQVLKVTSELNDDTKKADMTIQQITNDIDEVK
ncbi:hypothetical protein EDB87DRAFT_1825030 [Lactarius vividus]|nr:hypothetical protein EDB87DRAFT_1825030 [Lactarius vividus]